MSGKYFIEAKRSDGSFRTLFATEEQEAIIEMAIGTTHNLIINALAGAAKTSTLEFLCKYLPIQPMLCLAFNKRIAEEMAERLPGHVKCQTLNSMGHRVWMQVVSGKVNLDTKKTYRLLKQEIDALPRKEKEYAYDAFSDIMKVVGRAKINGYIPDGVAPHAKRLIETEAFWEGIINDVEDYPASIREIVDSVLTESIKESYKGTIDFDDQIYMSALFGGTFPKFPVVMVDETQDLSPLNHEMLKKLGGGRVIAVGDPWQSIYGFRGAVTNGMRNLAEHFRMVELTLSISFRCPRAVVRRAHSRVPHMRHAEWADEGEVSVLKTWTATTIPDGAAIICRNNAPLFKLAFDLIRGGRGIELRGFDIGPSLVKALKKLGPESLTAEQAYEAINRWEEEKSRKAAATAADRAECLRVFVDMGGSLKGAITYAESIFQAKGPIQLLSGHKSKGLEWDTVFHLDPWRVPSPFALGDEAIDQELNVKYVIETRPKRNLFLIDMKGYVL
jgi:superfamily I DNA/RNA helicase